MVDVPETEKTNKQTNHFRSVNYNLFMNNPTMNKFQSIIYPPLFWIISRHSFGRMLIPYKWNSADFELRKIPKTF